MERETKEITTTGGNKIVHKTYLNVLEHKAIKAALYGKATLKVEDEDVHYDGITAMSLEEKENKLVEMLTVSLNGKTENVMEEMLKLPYDEWYEVVKVYGEIGGKKK